MLWAIWNLLFRLAHNLMKLSGKFDTIVAVVGAGHVRGMKKLLEDEKIEVKVL